ncbi:MAG: hypothetical protein ACXABO_11365 [Promethearchaeota archaeon]|jgi:hypothetical protein
MDSIIYKVVFKALEEIENINLTLSFKYLDIEKPITLPAHFLLELKKLSETNEKVIHFQNIEEVIIIGDQESKFIPNYYSIILFVIGTSGVKRGYLIANIKNIGDVIIGIWPFNLNVSQHTSEEICKNASKVLKNPNNYHKICLVSQ